MTADRPSLEPDVFGAPLRDIIGTMLDEHRAALASSLAGLSEEQARRRLVPSDTTLLGLVKHATFVERVWFEEAVTGRSREELGLAAGPAESFTLDHDDTIASVLAGYTAACEDSRRTMATLDLDDVVTGNRRGPLPMRWILLHVLREVAQHVGHADILREQILAADG